MDHLKHIIIVSFVNPFTADPVEALHFTILVLPTIFKFWYSGTPALRTECQSARMSKINNRGLHQYGAELFEQQRLGTASVEGVKWTVVNINNTNLTKRLTAITNQTPVKSYAVWIGSRRWCDAITVCYKITMVSWVTSPAMLEILTTFGYRS